MGNIIIDKGYVGGTAVEKIYLGNELLYQRVEMYPKSEAPNGVYILTTDDYCVTRKDYVESGKVGMGIAIIQSNLRLVTAYEIIREVAWNPLGASHNELGYYDTLQDALTVTAARGKEMNAILNNSAWFNTGINAKAKEYSKGTLLAGSWYVPTVSQLYNITVSNWVEVREISKLFGSTLTTGSYELWTILQQSSGTAWAARMRYNTSYFSKHEFTDYGKKQTTAGDPVLALLPVADL